MNGMADDPVTQEVSALLKSIEDDYGAAASLARQCELTSSAVSSWKALKTRPGPEHWPVIEAFFKKPAGYLAAIDAGKQKPTKPDPRAPKAVTLADLDAKLDKIIRLVRGRKSAEQNLAESRAEVQRLARRKKLPDPASTEES